DCISKAEAAFMKAFAKAEQKGGCATIGDVGALDTLVDDFVAQVAAQLAGTTSTTVTTTTTVTTSPAPTTTSPGPTTTTATTSTTMGGPSTVTVTVGPNGNLVFDPASVTIKVGDTVRWTWASSFHSVVSGVVVNGANMPDGKFCSPNDMNCGTTVSDVGTV